MAFEVFRTRSTATKSSQLSTLLARPDLLVGDRLEELAYPQASCESCGSACRQDVICADYL